MDIITSLNNPKISLIASLKNKKFRDMHGLFIVEGKRAVQDAIKSDAVIKYIFCTEENLNLLEDLDKLQLTNNIILVTEQVMKKISDTDTPQGIIAVLNIKNTTFSNSGLTLLLDRISDPGNLGTIVRTAAACNVKNIFVCCGTDPYSPKCVRSTMGGINYINIFTEFTSIEALQLLKSNDYKIVSADMNGENLFNFDTNLDLEKTALIIGNEANGITDDLISLSDYIISLPMENVESLNAAVSASIILYNFKYQKS